MSPLSSTQHRSNLTRGYTLVELLVVIVIIAALAAISGSAVATVKNSTLKKRNTTFMAQLESSLQEFHLDFGEYPVATDGNGDNSGRLYECLVEGAEPDGSPAAGNGKITVYAPYLDENKSNSPYQNGEILDPYDTPYRYLDGFSHANANNPDFDLWSAGKDGEFGDITDPDDGEAIDNAKNW